VEAFNGLGVGFMCGLYIRMWWLGRGDGSFS
jgi:hypothetical protein